MSSIPKVPTADALGQLRAEHRQVQAWFREFQSTTSMVREEELAFRICSAIREHMEVDQEVVYPALLISMGDQYRLSAALSDHEAIADLITEIEHAGPTEEMFFAKLHVLCDMFERHVRDEEKPQGIFAEAQRAPLDLGSLAKMIQERKASVESKTVN